MSKILIVDDDAELAKSLRTFFLLHNYVVEVCGSGEDAMQLLASFIYDIIVLDWGLPEMSGKEVCQAYRTQGGHAPVIFLTGNDDVQFLEEGLDSGADDYMCKPFEIRELAARVKTLLKRRTGSFVPELKVGNLVLDPERNLLIKGEATVQLRAKETAILEYLIKHQNQLFSAQELLDAVWPADGDGTTNSVRTWMRLLRQKLSAIGEEHFIKTVLGSGYIIETKEKSR